MKAPKCNIKKRTKATHSKFRLYLGVLVIFFQIVGFPPTTNFFFTKKPDLSPNKAGRNSVKQELNAKKRSWKMKSTVN